MSVNNYKKKKKKSRSEVNNAVRIGMKKILNNVFIQRLTSH